jgi:DNA glycosylase AlkZ-like
VALAARLDGFERGALEAALDQGAVVKTTIMRMTLHLVDGDDYPAYHQLARQTRLRKWRKDYAHLEEEKVVADLGKWLREPRSNADIRARINRYDGVPTDHEWHAIMFARNLLPLVQLPPAGFWRERSRARFVVDPRPLPDPDDAAAFVLERYLGAFGPASRRDVAAWAGVAQRDFAAAWERLETVSYRGEDGTELLDLPDRPLPPASTKLPVRFLSRWDQVLLAYADRERIIPAELGPLRLTLSGDQTVTVDGRVAASWKLERATRRVRAVIEPHVEIRKSAHAQIRSEARRIAKFVEPDAETVEVTGV